MTEVRTWYPESKRESDPGGDPIVLINMDGNFGSLLPQWRGHVVIDVYLPDKIKGEAIMHHGTDQVAALGLIEGRRYEAQATALLVTSTPDPEQVAALAIMPGVPVLVVDAQEKVDIRSFVMEPYERVVFDDAGDPYHDVEWRVRSGIQVIVIGGTHEHIDGVVRQCHDAGVPCWVLLDHAAYRETNQLALELEAQLGVKAR